MPLFLSGFFYEPFGRFRMRGPDFCVIKLLRNFSVQTKISVRIRSRDIFVRTAAPRRLQFLTLQARRQAFSYCFFIFCRLNLRLIFGLNKKKNIEIINVLFVKIYSFGQTGFGVTVDSIHAGFFHAVFVRCRQHPCCLIGLFARAHSASNPGSF